MAVKHIVWDWNGTLLVDNDAVLAGVNAVCAAFGREPVDLGYWRQIYRRPLIDCYSELLRQELTPADFADIDRYYHDTYRALLDTVRLAPGVPDELRRWRDAGRSQSLLSMWFHHELVPLVTEYQLSAFFGRIDGLRVETGGGAKAEHLAAHLAAQELDPADVVLIGDVLDDAEAADAVGAACVLVSTGMASAATLSSGNAPVVDSVGAAMCAIWG